MLHFRNRRAEAELDRKIAAAEAALTEVKAKAAAELIAAQAKLAEAEARRDAAPARTRSLYESEVRARRYICDQFASLAS